MPEQTCVLQRRDEAVAQAFVALPSKGSSLKLKPSPAMAPNAPMLAAFVCCLCFVTVQAGTYEILQDTSKFTAVTWAGHMAPVRSTLFRLALLVPMRCCQSKFWRMRRGQVSTSCGVSGSNPRPVAAAC
jgi:hypothetical protein